MGYVLSKMVRETRTKAMIHCIAAPLRSLRERKIFCNGVSHAPSLKGFIGVILKKISSMGYVLSKMVRETRTKAINFSRRSQGSGDATLGSLIAA